MDYAFGILSVSEVTDVTLRTHRYLIVEVRDPGHWRRPSLNSDFASRVEHDLTAAGITHFHAIIACNKYRDSYNDVAIAFSSSARFDRNFSQDIASVFDKVITSSNNKVRFRLSSFGATEPLSIDQITHHPAFGKYPLQYCQLRVDSMPESDAQTHLHRRTWEIQVDSGKQDRKGEGTWCLAFEMIL
jgi:hypothetical protein